MLHQSNFRGINMMRLRCRLVLHAIVDDGRCGDVDSRDGRLRGQSPEETRFKCATGFRGNE
jgi:hypothetical protein